MNPVLIVLILLFVVVDAIVVYVVLSRAVAKNGGSLLKGIDLRRIAGFSKEMHERVGTWLQANYSGDPSQLPQAMTGLMAMARSRAQEQGLALDDDALRKLVETSVLQHRVAKPDEIREAFRNAA